MPKGKFFFKFLLSLLMLAVFLPSLAAPQKSLEALAAGKALAASEALATYRWQARLLLVFTPSLEAPSWQKQAAAWPAEVAALAERRLRVLVITASAVYWLSFTPALPAADLPQVVLLPPAEDFPDASALRVAYGLDAAGAAAEVMFLIGLDGTEKARYVLPVALGEVFAEIDRMPMRQWELRQY